MKTCSKCGEMKGLEAFSGQKAMRCLACRKAYKQAWAQENAERIKAQKVARYTANREQVLVDSREYYKTHRREAIARAKDWAHKNQSKRKVAANKYAKKAWRDPVLGPRIRSRQCPEKARQKQKRCTDRLTKNYVRGLLVQGTDLTRQDVPMALVEEKRRVLQTQRIGKQIKSLLNGE